VLLVAVGLLLAIATANVANLLLMRGEHRRTECAVRMALGASRARLVAQPLIEGLVVAGVAATAALAIVRSVLPIVVSLVPDGLPRPESIYIDAHVWAFTAAIAVSAAALAGIVPGLMATRLNLGSGLRTGGRGVAGSASARGRRVLVAAQVALAVTVVASAGLLARSLQRLQTADMGLRADHLILAELDLPSADYGDQVRRRRFFDAVLTRIRAAPGIDAVTPFNALPFAGASGWDVPSFTGEGQTVDQVTANPPLNFEVVQPDYFETLGVRLVRGRGFTDADREGAPSVVIVSDTVAARAWPGGDAIGKRLKFGHIDSREPWLTVVGVAATTRYRELATPRPTLYLPADQFMFTFGRLAVRTTADPSAVARLVRGVVEAVDPAVRVERVAPYTHYLRGPLAWPRFNALLLGVFALSGLLLSAIGLYGVMAASVRQRHREIGVRMAVGATQAHVRRLVVREGLVLATAGGAAGLALALASTRALRGLLYEVQPLDPVSLGGATVVLVAVALAATWLPARRATRVDPVEVLRAE
jgi:putative ABC transport system permease protein